MRIKAYIFYLVFNHSLKRIEILESVIDIYGASGSKDIQIYNAAPIAATFIMIYTDDNHTDDALRLKSYAKFNFVLKKHEESITKRPSTSYPESPSILNSAYCYCILRVSLHRC